MKIKNTLNGAVVEIGDNDAKTLLDSGFWVADGGVAKKPRRAAAKAAAPESEPEE